MVDPSIFATRAPGKPGKLPYKENEMKILIHYTDQWTSKNVIVKI